MIDKNGKLFGKVSIVDLAAILAVLIAAAGIYVRFFGGPSKTVVQSSKFYYTVNVQNIRGENMEGLKKCVGGNFYLNEKITSEMGKLISADESPGTVDIEMSDGTLIVAEVPNRYNVLLTLEMTGKVNDVGYFSPSLERISAGVAYNLKGKWSAVNGIVQDVWEE